MNIDFDMIRNEKSASQWSYPEVVINAFKRYWGYLPSENMSMGEKFNLNFLNAHYAHNGIRDVDQLFVLLKDRLIENHNVKGRVIESGAGHRPTTVLQNGERK